MANKSSVKSLQKGEYLSEMQFYKVVDISHGTVRVRNERGFEYSASEKIVEEGMYSATQYNEEKSVTRTELIEILSKAWGAVFTANYNKQPKNEDINKAIEGTNAGKIKPMVEAKKSIKKAFEGENRTVIGYLIKVETGFGRSVVIDLEKTQDPTKDYETRISQIDHRTLNWMIYQNVKYIAR